MGLVDRLEGVRSLGDDHWIAQCPSHEDGRPSLDVRLAKSGKTLIYCHAGCRANEVLEALGLTWNALFPGRPMGPARHSQSETEAQRARRKVLEHEERARARRRRWLPAWVGADHVRELMKLVITIRSAAAQLDDEPASWALLDFAAALELETLNTEFGLDTVVAEGRVA